MASERWILQEKPSCSMSHRFPLQSNSLVLHEENSAHVENRQSQQWKWLLQQSTHATHVWGAAHGSGLCKHLMVLIKPSSLKYRCSFTFNRFFPLNSHVWLELLPVFYDLNSVQVDGFLKSRHVWRVAGLTVVTFESCFCTWIHKRRVKSPQFSYSLL